MSGSGQDRKVRALTDDLEEARRTLTVTERFRKAGIGGAVALPLAFVGALLLNSWPFALAMLIATLAAWLGLAASYGRVSLNKPDRITGRTQYLPRIEVDRRRYREAARELNDYWIEQGENL